MQGWVYVLGGLDKDGTIFRIGKSGANSLDGRLRNHRSEFPFDMTAPVLMLVRDMTGAENELHSMFRSQRTRPNARQCSTYYLSAEDIATIQDTLRRWE